MMRSKHTCSYLEQRKKIDRCVDTNRRKHGELCDKSARERQHLQVRFRQITHVGCQGDLYNM